MNRQDERMAMLEAENDNLRHRIAVLESLVKKLEANRDIPRYTSWHVPQWAVDSCEKKQGHSGE